MFGGISRRGRSLVLGRPGAVGEVLIFDLQGECVRNRFPVGGLRGGPADLAGVAVAEDGRVFLSDTTGCCIRIFNSFGKELGRIGLPEGVSRPRDRRGLPAWPKGILLDSRERLWVACGDRAWVHGLQIFETDGGFVASLPAHGDRTRTFGAPRGLCLDGREVWVADTLSDCLQVFREDGTYLATHRPWKDRQRPIAIAPFGGGQAVLFWEPEPEILLMDEHQKPRGRLALPGGKGLEGPSDLAPGEEGGLLVLDGDRERILRFDAEGGLRAVLSGIPG